MASCRRDAASSTGEQGGQRDARGRLGSAGVRHPPAWRRAGEGRRRRDPAGILLAFRGYRMGAETRSGSVIIWGMPRTHVIPSDAIDEITDFPAVVWTDPVGNGRWSPLLVFQPRRGHSRALPSTTLPACSDSGSGRVIDDARALSANAANRSLRQEEGASFQPRAGLRWSPYPMRHLADLGRVGGLSS